MMTLSVDGETKCGRRAERIARSGQRIVKLTGDRALASASCALGTVCALPPQPVAASTSAAAQPAARDVT
jgi:hypothetical protein